MPDDRVYTQSDLNKVAQEWREVGAAGIQQTRDKANEAFKRGGEFLERQAAKQVAAAIAETQQELTHEYQHELNVREQQMSNDAEQFARGLDGRAKSYASRVELDAERKVQSVQRQAEFLH